MAGCWFGAAVATGSFRHPSKPGTVTVAGKPSLEIPVGTLRSALKQAGLLGLKE
jgi:predicted RNA binding protein YcfA (HicA-like mRNA interferase family)